MELIHDPKNAVHARFARTLGDAVSLSPVDGSTDDRCRSTSRENKRKMIGRTLSTAAESVQSRKTRSSIERLFSFPVVHVEICCLRVSGANRIDEAVSES